MARSIHVRLDAPAEADLAVLRALGDGTDSAAVRTAIREAAARCRARESLAALAVRLAGDDADRAEMREIRELLDDLAPEGED